MLYFFELLSHGRRYTMYRQVDKVVTEYIFIVGNFDFRIKGRIQEKLGLSSTAELVRYALEHQLL